MNLSKKILILSNHFITLYSFRKELILRLVEAGNEVYISMPESAENKFFLDLGCNIIATPVDRRGVNPLRDLKLTYDYFKIMSNLDPDVILSYTVKPNIYGCIASNFTKHPQISNITGTGATFLKKSIVSTIAKQLYRFSVKKSYKVFFQNNGDKDYFIQNKMIENNYALLPGSGVNLEQYTVSEFPSDTSTKFIYIGRIMKVKGVEQYLECAQKISAQYPNTQFYMAGFIEESEYKQKIDEYHKKEIIHYLGFQKDIKEWIRQCHCTILPSHGGEGVPNVLLETSAMGRVCIASAINGSRDVVEDGVTGYLFEPGNSGDLTEKVNRFIGLCYEDKKSMGLAGRTKVEKEFDRKIVINTYLDEITKLGSKGV